MSQRGVYRGIYSALPDDPDFQWLTAKARLLLLVARICKQAGPAVIFRYYPALLSAQTGLPIKDIRAAMTELQEGKWIEFDEHVLWVRNGLRYDPYLNLRNERQRLGVERALAELPKSQVVLNFCDYYQIVKPFERVSDVRITEYRVPSTEDTRVPIPSNPSPRAEEGWGRPEDLVALYNAVAPDECPAVTVLSPRRRKKAAAYLAMFPTRVFWEETCGQIRASRFLRGLRPTNGHERFVADFDWLLTQGKDGSENCVKVYEGKYHD